jgi:hypothetical protein
MKNANTPSASAVGPVQRTDATIRADGASADRLVPGNPPVRFGVLQGQAWIAHDFDAPLPDYLLDAFEGR